MRTRTIFTAMLLITSITAMAQSSVFEDDIYYSPKKDNKATKRVEAEVRQVETTTTTIQNAPTYNNKNDFDVDAYNRRYSGSSADSGTTPATTTQNSVTTTTTTTQTYYANGVGSNNMEYAERIRRFYNPEIGLYVVDPEYNDIYLIESDYTPYISSVNIITSPWVTPWSWNYSFGWNYPYSSWSWSIGYNPWYYPIAYYPYYPGYYPPRPYPGYRPTPPPAHRPEYNPVPPRQNGNYGHRYSPGSSVGTGGRTDGADRHKGTISSSRKAPAINNNSTTNRGTGAFGGRNSSGGSNKEVSKRGGSFTAPSYSTPSTTAPSRQSYSPSNSGGGSRVSSGSRVTSPSGRSVGGRGSR